MINFSLRDDTFIAGLVYGFLSFAFAAFLFTKLNDWAFSTIFKNATGFSKHFIFIMAACFNIIPFQIFNRQDRENKMRGLVYATVLLVLGILFYFKGEIGT